MLKERRPFFRVLLIGISANLKLSYIFEILLVLYRVRVDLCLNLVQLFDTAEFNPSSLCLIQEDGLGIGESQHQFHELLLSNTVTAGGYITSRFVALA
jgi:hypothetical protein